MQYMSNNRLKLTLSLLLTLVLGLSSCNLGEDGESSETSESTTPPTTEYRDPIVVDPDVDNIDIVLSEEKINPQYTVSNPGTGIQDTTLEIAVINSDNAEEIYTPIWYTSEFNHYLVHGLMDGATRFNEDGSILEDGGPITYSFNEDEASLTMEIDSDFKWSNGETVDADDIITSYELTLTEGFMSSGITQNYKLYDNIIGAEEFYYEYSDDIAGIERLSDSSVKISFEEWNPLIKWGEGILLEFAPSEILEESTSSFSISRHPLINESPLSYGPYVLVNVDSSAYQYESNPHYWGEEAKVKNINLNRISNFGLNNVLTQAEYDIIYLPTEYYGEVHVLRNSDVLMRESGMVSYLAFRMGESLSEDELNEAQDEFEAADEERFDELISIIRDRRRELEDELNNEIAEMSSQDDADASDDTDETGEDPIQAHREERQAEIDAEIAAMPESIEHTEISLKRDIFEMRQAFKDIDSSVQEQALREAVRNSIDVNSINLDAYHGLQLEAKSAMPLSLDEFYVENQELLTYNVGRTNEILDEAGLIDADGDGFRESANGEKIKLNILIENKSQVDDDISKYVAQQVRLFGLDAEIELLNPNRYFEELQSLDSSDPEEILVFLGYMDFDNNPSIREYFAEDGVYNFIYLEDEENQTFAEQFDNAETIEEVKETINSWTEYLAESYYYRALRSNYDIVVVNKRVSQFAITHHTYPGYSEIDLTSLRPLRVNQFDD